MSRNNDYTTVNLLVHFYHQNYHKLIGVDLSSQTNTSSPQQINFLGLEDDCATMLFVSEKQNYSELFFRFINCNRIIWKREHQKILNLLNKASDSKFMTRKWNILYDQSNANYDVANETRYNTEALKSNLCD